MVFSKFPRKSRVRPSVCSKRTFSCYFWRKSNQNVGVGCAIKDVGNCLALPHKQCPQKLLLPAAVHTPPHPRFRTALASSLLIGRVAANLIEERKLLLRRNKYACQKKVYIRISCVCHLNFLSALSHSHIPVKGVWGLCRTRMAEQKNLPALHAPLTTILSEGACSPILSCQGGMGAPHPCLPMALDLPHKKTASQAVFYC